MATLAIVLGSAEKFNSNWSDEAGSGNWISAGLAKPANVVQIRSDLAWVLFIGILFGRNVPAQPICPCPLYCRPRLTDST